MSAGEGNGNLDSGSFRDPRGRVYVKDGRVFRTIMPCAAADFEFAAATGLIEALEKEGLVVESRKVDGHVLGEESKGAVFVVEHPPIPFISYPYEWSFPALKSAALLHLDIHLRALDYGVSLSDASAYNIQFIGPRPVFIDRLSFKRYQEGEFWLGHRQFCEQFLNPLLLRSMLGIPHNHWYRGTQEGIRSNDMRNLIPIRKKLSIKVLKHIVAPVSLQKSVSKEIIEENQKVYNGAELPLKTLINLLKSLKKWIDGLHPHDTDKTTWSDYSRTHSYSSGELKKKHRFVYEFVQSVKPGMCWDLGCNIGDFSATALKAGSRSVVGFDLDHRVLECAFARASEESMHFLPLFFDAANPSPNQGWAERERKGLQARASADACLSLAFTHHLAIGRNIPLSDLLPWLSGLAPTGVTEFIPKSDPMVQHMLRLREDIFEDYTEEHFLSCIKKQAKIVQMETISKSGRKLISYCRNE